MSEGFTREKRFKSTEEVYGVNPMELAEMKYWEAEIVKYTHAKRKYADVIEKMFSLPLEKELYYEHVALNEEMKKYDKAIKLAELHLIEIGIDYSKINWEV